MKSEFIMAIKSDSQGFILGERRLKEMSQGISQTEINTKEILNVLTNSLKEQQRKQAKYETTQSDHDSTPVRRKSRDAGDDIHKTVKAAREAASEVRKTVESAQEVVKIQRKSQDSERGLYRDKGNAKRTSVEDRVTAARVRDSKGRFIGSGGSGSSSSQSEANQKSFMKNLKSAFSGSGAIGVNPRGIDPTIDALGELKDVVSPVGGVFGRMSAKAASLFAGRTKKRKNEEILPEEQAKANKTEQRNDVRRNKLLERLIDVVRSGAKKGGGLLGGVLGRGKGGLLGLLLGGGKAVLKRVPLLGALFGGAALANNWGKSDNGEKGKGMGKIIGTVIGGALGSFLSPVGTVAGGVLGNYLGGIFGQKVGEWTAGLRNIKFGELFTDAIKSIFDTGKTALKIATSPFGVVGSAIGGIYDRAKQGFGGGGASGSYSDAGSSKLPSSKMRDERQLGMYNALRKAGFSDNQALAIGGEIGRENDYGDAMFATHTDPARDKHGNQIKNGGVLSWNKGRYDKFQKFMTGKGLMDANGNMPKNQASMDAQAEFIKQEMLSKDYRNVTRNFMGDTKGDPKQSAAELAKYIGWARGQTTIRGEKGNRVPFDSPMHERKINGYIDRGIGLRDKDGNLQKASRGIPETIRKPHVVKALPAGVARPAPIKIPSVKAELASLSGQSAMKPISSSPQDSSISQSVADRNLAHIMGGGIGHNG